MADRLYETPLSFGSPWPGVEIRMLVALERVAATGSFSRAAAQLGYTQSAVSGQIGALERAVGVRLVDRVRGARTVGLTAEGVVLYRHAVEITARLRSAHAELAAQTARDDAVVQDEKEPGRAGLRLPRHIPGSHSRRASSA
jgi:molybdenum-dependent DNA-binding transcriptional regulator ModE